MTKKIITSYLFKERLAILNKKIVLYNTPLDAEQKYAFQIAAFNKLWKEISHNNPFYRFWSKKHSLPEQIKSVGELEKFPVITKEIINEYRELIFKELNNFSMVSTGGSTGVPTRFPTCRSEKNQEYANTYLGKSWWGINPFDHILMFWGHSHLFGTGYKGRIRHLKRLMGDWLINTQRLNAYDMTMESLGKYCEKVSDSKPEVIIGYTSCIYKASKLFHDKKEKVSNPNLKAIILTSESVCDKDMEIISGVFGVPVLLEYGMAETGVIAYSRKQAQNIEVFWDSFVCTEDVSGKLYVTTLNDRLFPLIRYDTSDLAVASEKWSGSILALQRITGRSQDELNIRTVNGGCLTVSGILVVHILKGLPDIYSIAFEQKENNKIIVKLTSQKQLDLTDIKSAFDKIILKDHPALDCSAVTFVQDRNIVLTVAGKEKTYAR